MCNLQHSEISRAECSRLSVSLCMLLIKVSLACRLYHYAFASFHFFGLFSHAMLQDHSPAPSFPSCCDGSCCRRHSSSCITATAPSTNQSGARSCNSCRLVCGRHRPRPHLLHWCALLALTHCILRCDFARVRRADNYVTTLRSRACVESFCADHARHRSVSLQVFTSSLDFLPQTAAFFN
jgi:hypothetical protein